MQVRGEIEKEKSDIERLKEKEVQEKKSESERVKEKELEEEKN